MKKIFLLTILLFTTIQSFSQNFIPFQGIATDGSGKVISSQKISLRISILKDNVNGSISYTETHSPSTDKNGLFQINIGTGLTNTNSFASIDWSTLNYFVKVEMDVLGGGNFQLISTTKLGAVPYALYSTRSQNPAIYQNVGNTADTLTIDDNVTICETQDGSWRQVFKLPQPTVSNGQLANRRNTTLLFNCKSSFSFIISKQNSNLRDDLQVSKGEYVLFFFDGERWMYYGGKTPQNDIRNNTYFGQNSLMKLTTGRSNQAFGSGSLSENTTGSNNIAIGAGTMSSNQTGNENIVIGFGAFGTSRTASANTVIGWRALEQFSTGTQNLTMGQFAMRTFQSGTANTAIGASALENIPSGNFNVGIGFSAGANNGNLPINFSTAIGTYSTVTTSNTMALGAKNYTLKWAFGRSTTDYALQVGNDTNDGNGAFLTKGGAWTNSSSRAFKDNFEDLSNSEILSKLSQLNIQKWKYKGTDETHIGPIAEEFKDLFNLGVKGDNEHIGTIDTSGIALKAIQALMEEIKLLKEKISALEKNK